MSKKAIKALAGTCILALGLPALASNPAEASPSNQVYLEDQLLNTEKPIFNRDSRTLMSYRDFYTAIGGQVSWDSTTRIASCDYGDSHIQIDPDQGTITTNGVTKGLDVPPQFINDHIYLPIRFFGESLGYQVNYQQEADGTNIVKLYRLANFATINGPQVSFTLPAASASTQGQVAYTLDQGYFLRQWEQDGKLYRERLSLADGSLANYTDNLANGVHITEPYLDETGKVVFADNNTGLSHLDGITGPLFPGDYLGYGEATNAFGTPLKTQQFEKIPVYSTKGSLSQVSGSQESLTTTNSHDGGWLVDVSQYNLDGKTPAAYTMTEDGSMGLLMDKQFVLVRNYNGVPKVYTEIPDFGGEALTAIGNTIYAYGADGPRVCYGKVGSDGQNQTVYHTAYTFSQADDMTVYDVDMNDTTLYALARDTARAYAVKIDLTTGTITETALPRYITYSQLIPDSDGSFAALALQGDKVDLYHLN